MVLLITLFWWMGSGDQISTLNGYKTAKVVRVWDGDTYTLLVGGNKISARLKNIDSPEMSQLYGKECKEALEALLLSKDVSFSIDGLDKYKRYLVQLWVDGERLDKVLLKNGWAWHYVTYSQDEELVKLQQEAIRKRIGLWEGGVEGICPPWIYRQYNRINRLKYCSNCKR